MSPCRSGSRTSTGGPEHAASLGISATIRRLAGAARDFPRQKALRMSYAIISVGGKQYRVREGERLLVDRLALEDGATFTPSVLLTGGDGAARVAPAGVVVTAKVVRQ